MVLVALEELIDINPWHGLRFGNLDPVEDAWIERYYVSGSYYCFARADFNCAMAASCLRPTGRWRFDMSVFRRTE